MTSSGVKNANRNSHESTSPAPVRTSPGSPSRPRPGSPTRNILHRKYTIDQLFLVPTKVGPRIVVGTLWCGLTAAAIFFDPIFVAALFSVIAMVAALQASRSWKRQQRFVPTWFVSVVAALLPWSAVAGRALLGVCVLVCLGAGALVAVMHSQNVMKIVGIIGRCIQIGFLPGFAAASFVVITSIDSKASMLFLVLIASYDAGSYLLGSDCKNPIWAIIGGILLGLAATFSIAAFQLSPFGGDIAAWVFGGLAIALAPIGQLVASSILPSMRTPAPALRRLDSLLVAAPVWMFLLWEYVQ